MTGMNTRTKYIFQYGKKPFSGARRLRRLLAVGFLLMICGSTLQAQHYLGVRGGYGGGSVRFDPKEETGMLWGFPSAGVSWKYYSPIKYVGAIELDIQRVGKGYKRYERVGADTAYHREVSAIEMPFFWQPHVYFFNRKARMFLNLGVYVSYIYASDSSTVSKTHGTLSEGKYPMRLVKDNRWEYGLCGGFGFGVFIKRLEILVEARYSFGYSDLLKNGNKYPGNPQRSPMDQINISMGIYYRLGKGGILSPPALRKKNKTD